MLFNPFRRGESIESLEAGGEGRKGLEACGDTDTGDVVVLVCQESCSLFQSHVLDKVAWSLSCQILHLTIEMHTTDAHLVCHQFDRQFWIVHILVDDLHHTFHQVLVG